MNDSAPTTTAGIPITSAASPLPVSLTVQMPHPQLPEITASTPYSTSLRWNSSVCALGLMGLYDPPLPISSMK